MTRKSSLPLNLNLYLALPHSLLVVTARIDFAPSSYNLPVLYQIQLVTGPLGKVRDLPKRVYFEVRHWE